MLIAQLSDIHVGFEQGQGADELNRQRLRAVVARLRESPNPPDLLVLSGDLTDHGDATSFAHLVEDLGQWPIPVLPMVGNHDSREELLRAFPDCPCEGGFIHYAMESEGLRTIALDTFEPGRHGGAFCEARAGWLSAQLAAHPDTPTLIFMHHPPIISGIDWMDPAPDEAWIARFAEAIAGHGQIRAIHCGHLHRTTHATFRGVPLGIAPSVAPPVALDLRPISPDAPDGRALITSEPPGYALHRLDGTNLVTHYEHIGDWHALASYQPELRGMVRDMIAERS